MTRKNSSPPSRRGAIARRFGFAFGMLALVLIALYALTPFLVTRIAPHLAERFELKTLELEIGYPRWQGIDIDRLAVVTDAVEIRGLQARMDYSWSGLRDGVIDSLVFAELEIRLPSDTVPDKSAEAPADNALFPENPFQRLIAEKLLVIFPDTGFVGTGHAGVADGLLSLSLDGVEPELASRFSITADLSREGVFHAYFGERGANTTRFLSLNGVIGSDSINIDGNASLTGFPLQMISELAGLPQGAGEVSGQIQTQLPWPLPATVSWREQVIDVPAFSVDWQSTSDDLQLKLDGLAGSARLNRGDVDATVSGGLVYQLEQRQFTAQLPADYLLQLRQDTLSGAAGPRLTVKDGANEAAAVIQSFMLRDQPEIYLEVAADIEARTGNAQAIGRLSGKLEGQALGIEGDFVLKNDPPRQKGKPVSIASGGGTLTASIRTTLPSPLPEKLVWQELTATLPSFAVDWKSVNNDLKVTKLGGSAGLDYGKIAATVNGSARYRLAENTVNIQIPKNYRLTFSQDKLNGGAGLHLSVKEDATDVAATLRSFSLNTAATPKLDFDASIDAKLDATQSAGRLKAQLRIEDTTRNRSSGRMDYSGLVKIDGQQHDGDLNATFNVRGNAVTAAGVLDSGLFNKVPLTLDYNLESGAGSLLATHTFEFRNTITAKLIPDWQEVYDLDAGRIEAELTLNWQTLETIAAHLSAKLSGGRAHYEDYLASGINGHLNLRANDSSNIEDWWLEPTIMQVDRVDVGIPLDNLVFGLAWSGDQVQIRDASATLLGGQATAAPFSYTISTGSGAFEMLLKDIDLAAVLALEGDDVTGTGKLSGSLPVIIKNDTPRIEGGLLSAAAPGGYLRLSPTLSMPGGQQNLTFALTALQDFTYTELKTQIDYAENGDLKLAVHLRGRNPAVEKGRPIIYNLNISENVPVLLESLRLQDTLTEGIEKKLQK